MIMTWRSPVMRATGPATGSPMSPGSPAVMSDELSARIEKHFASLTDPRRRKVTHPLINIVTIALCAVIAGADDFVTIAAWRRPKRAWLARFLDMTKGVPSHGRFNAVLRRSSPTSSSVACSPGSPRSARSPPGNSSPSTASRSGMASTRPTYMASAWATANHISLGQVVVDEKSNEITAIPELLELLNVSGCLVTIDATGCQTKIAGKIVEDKADYVLAAKGNQPTLHDGIMGFFLGHMEDDFARVKVNRHEAREHGHGRDEHRTYLVCDVPDDLPDRGRWKGLKRLGVSISETARGGQTKRLTTAWGEDYLEKVLFGT
jgi:predicted transposase YbfD/YdcC